MKTILLLCILLSSVLSINHHIVNTVYGQVSGTDSYSSTGKPLKIWRGVPYAAPPIGDLRFASPVEPVAWRPKVLECTQRKAICPQLESEFGLVIGAEDCLHLDVYAPEGSNENSSLPVMVWIYGGGYVIGDKYELGLYEASNVVAKHENYVHVAMNYRLSALGFMALEGARSENQYNSTGNYALQDQQLALKFVRDNIKAFGGDPEKVTIFGESAGAFSVCWHLVSPVSKGLFRAAIMESGNCENPSFYFKLEDSLSFGKSYADAVGCDSTLNNDKELLKCLRELSLAEVLHGGALRAGNVKSSFKPLLYPFMPWGASIDNSDHGLIGLPWDLIKSGNFNRVPVILGTNANEGNIFVPAVPFIVGVWFPLNKATTLQSLHHFFNESTSNTIMKMYSNSANNWESVLSLVIRDWIFACPARRVAEHLSQHVATYLYHFTFKSPNWVDQWILGDYHSSELEFVFHNPWPPVIHHFDKDDEKMANIISGYWNNLAVSGISPNKGPNTALLTWPQYTLKSPSLMNLKVPPQVDTHYLDNICTFWDTVITQ